MTSSPLCIANMVVNETSSSVTVPPTRQGPCSDNARPRPTSEASCKKSPGFGRPARPRNRSEILKRILASAGRGQRALLWRGRKFMDSSIPRGSTDSANGGRFCQPGLSVANFFANCRKRLTEQNVSSPLVWAFGSGIIRPETNASHWVQRAGFGQPFIASAQKVMFHGGVLREFGVSAR